MSKQMWIGLVVVAIVVGIGLVYWLNGVNRNNLDYNYSPATNNNAVQPDSASSIEADLNTIDVNSLDAESQQIQTEANGL